jgi:uncharacterized cysteine cluster protein YcgN (CxxCxxCC family)
VHRTGRARFVNTPMRPGNPDSSKQEGPATGAAGDPDGRQPPQEWESLCDGCAKCCLQRFEDIDTREIQFTNVCCRYLDASTCRCSDYPNRSKNVPDCVSVTPEILVDPYWLPSTCAYRLLAEGRALPDWHPLVSGDAESVFRAGQAVRDRVVSEEQVVDLEHHLIDWIT